MGALYAKSLRTEWLESLLTQNPPGTVGLWLWLLAEVLLIRLKKREVRNFLNTIGKKHHARGARQRSDPESHRCGRASLFSHGSSPAGLDHLRLALAFSVESPAP